MKKDPYQKKDEGYFIRSLYFDDLQNSAVEEKLAGIAKRDKFRLRIYDTNQNWAKLERKSKQGDYVNKLSVSVSKPVAQEIIFGNYRGLLKYKEKTATQLFLSFTHQYLRPVSIVDYVREVWQLPYNNIRITFDKKLRISDTNLDLFDPNLLTVPLLPPEIMVLEVKYDHFLPSWFNKLLHLEKGAHCAISKYTQSRLKTNEFIDFQSA